MLECELFYWVLLSIYCKTTFKTVKGFEGVKNSEEIQKILEENLVDLN